MPYISSSGFESRILIDDGHDGFESLVADGVSRFRHRIHAYCWMVNHVRLAIQLADTPLSKIMQSLAFRYTRFINRREERIGHLFRGNLRLCWLMRIPGGLGALYSTESGSREAG